MTKDKYKKEKAHMEWFRLITPLSVVGAATIFWFQFTHMQQSFDTMATNMSALSSDMSAVKADVQNIDERLLRDETMIDSKKN